MEIANNSLTKHLYRLDEVVSSLRWSIITHSIHDTAFWTIELYESNFEQECLEMLETLWITNIGFSSWYSLRLIQHIYEKGETSRDDLVQITCAFAKRRLCDSTIFHLLLRGATTSVEWKPSFPHTMEYKTIREAVEDCLKRGKLKEAWLLGRAMDKSEQWNMLEVLAKSKDRLDAFLIIKTLRQSVYENLCTAYVMVSLDDISWLTSQSQIDNTIPSEVYDSMKEWENEKSMRKRRAIKPRVEALLYLTQRSKQTPYETSEIDIQSCLEETLRKSEYWSCILETYMHNSKWKSDDHKESFYDTYFKDDIPDEWSLACREQSHGRGLGKTVEQARVRFIQHTIQRSKSLELWNSVFPNETDCSMEWDTIYGEQTIEISLPMKPVARVFEIS